MFHNFQFTDNEMLKLNPMKPRPPTLFRQYPAIILTYSKSNIKIELRDLESPLPW